MRKLPVISSDPLLNDRAARVCAKFGYEFEPVFLESGDEALEYLMYELPEISVVNYSDPAIDMLSVLEAVKADPWLHYGGLVAVHSRRDAKAVADVMPDSNILSLIPRSEFVTGFFRVLRILIQNRQIVFQRELQSHLIGNISGSFVMDSDPLNIRTYANLVSNFLFNSNYIDRDGRERLHVAIFESLMNAVEHGNCAISYDEKSEWLERHGDILPLIRQKLQKREIRNKRVFFSYRITPERSFYTIRDEGNGFDWRKHLDAGAGTVNLSLHGHGIRMANHYVDALSYNESGNEVSFEMAHHADAANAVPAFFADQDEAVFEDGETVFMQGEESNFLYYIISGKLDVLTDGTLVSTLSADDIFLGEMSFLLNNRRSATVKSNGRSVLIRITKNSFVSTIKAKPHYGIFLARLLANRLSRLNASFARTHG
ncbi:MAG: hypothetical protein EA426_09365 [Spirochaetaceae bacterium]|nr:MAG: hypothetical protein EA426_09365 [Spirochaetaceae bacterium]